MSRPGRKRLSIDVPIKLHTILKSVAKHRNLNITRYVIRALLRYSLYENRYEEYYDSLKDIK